MFLRSLSAEALLICLPTAPLQQVQFVDCEAARHWHQLVEIADLMHGHIACRAFEHLSIANLHLAHHCFQQAAYIVDECLVIRTLYEEIVVDARMLEVMADSCRQNTMSWSTMLSH